MEHASVEPASGVLELRLKNVAASAAVVGAACTAYWLAPNNERQLGSLLGSTAFSFTGAEFLLTGALTYTGLLALYFLGARDPGPSKSLIFFRVAAAFAASPLALARRGVSREERVALLATLLKAFFGPLMALSLAAFCAGAIGQGIAVGSSVGSVTDLRALFDRHGFSFLMQVILFVDVLVFTLGYLIELPALGNSIRSVDPTLLGWAAAMLCYPPFNSVSGAILGSPRSDFPQFDNPTAHLLLNATLLLLMAIYSSASVALGFKASNLTHRGIVVRGPYRLVRHPAYACKNIAWWIGSLPLVGSAFAQSTVDGLQAVASVIGWTLLYVFRALTEEDHLRSVDSAYEDYAARVRYRFIPGLI
jgi:protein-S-isoprenylcysteine O-methyltransferase Ste14